MTAALAVNDLSRTYQTAGGPLTVLDGISFSVEPGTSLAIVGPSGSGKSTLLGLIAGLDRASRGTVHVAGTDLATLSDDHLAAFRAVNLGYVFQNFRLLPGLTALDNVRLPLDLVGAADTARRATEALTRCGLGARLHHLPDRLSGGEQQRVALARALIAEPRLVVADEPTGNLDHATGATIADLLLERVRAGAAALVVVTHDERLAARADRILRLHAGRIAA